MNILVYSHIIIEFNNGGRPQTPNADENNVFNSNKARSTSNY